MQAREREHMQKIAEYQMSVVQHKRVLQNANAGLNASYSRAQQQLRREEDAIWQENEDALIKHMQKSTYGDLAASGRTGRSVARIGTMEVAALGRFYADQNSKLTDAFTDFRAGQSSAKAKAGSMMEQSFANVAFAPIADVKPPDPVFGSVGAAFAGDAMNFIGTAATVGGALSSKKLKDNIIKIGKSIAGHNIYTFNYIGDTQKYIGVIAEEVLNIKPEAVVTMSNGFLGVIYDLIDVEFRMA